MSFIDRLHSRLQRHPKRIVFPEGTDPRIMQAARQFATRRLGAPILLGDRGEIKDRAARLDIRLDGIRILEPERSDDLELFLPMVDEHPKLASLSADEKRAVLLDRHNFAALMVRSRQADALLAGATMSASSGLRSLFRMLPLRPQVKSASSLLILDQENPNYGMDGVLFLADCGVIPEPSAEQLADIALTTAHTAYHLTNDTPRVAFLSYATRSRRPTHASIGKIREALAMAQERCAQLPFEVLLDGELQLDAALSPMVAEQKNVTDSPVAGRANVLIFPDLNSGNIASKMIQLVAGARTYGQVITGFQNPCAEISRGAHVYDILGTAVITCAQAIDRNLLFAEN